MEPGGTSGERAARDAAAYDERQVLEKSKVWHRRVVHVLHGPNTQAAEAEFERLLRESAAGGRVLDVGCGSGTLTRRVVHEDGAVYALGIDVADTMLARAETFEEPGRIEFRKHDASRPLQERFDLIVGRSVLHHLDFRDFLSTAYARNLAPGGRLLFMEPCSHPMTLAFHKLVRSAHTDDEFPLLPRDVRWLHEQFSQARVEPVNLASFPAGVVSSFVFSSADNWLMRAADRADRALARRPRLEAYGRQGIVVIDKPS
jgi:SAM-dependent methyltransferase